MTAAAQRFFKMQLEQAHKEGAEDMRERMLDWLMENRPERPQTERGIGYQKAYDDIDAAIRALPLDERG